MAGKTLVGKYGHYLVVVMFLASGILHLVNPTAFLWLMPPFLPEPILLIHLSGVAELVAAAGLILKMRFAPIFTALVLLAVWPANWWFAIESASSNPDLTLAAWLRLPLQLPLIWFALRAPVRSKDSKTRSA